MTFLIQCPDCGYAQELDVLELEDDPRCNVCTFYLGWEEDSLEGENDSRIQTLSTGDNPEST